MKKSIMDRISRKKMSKRRMKNCGDTKGRGRTELFNTPFISEEEKAMGNNRHLSVKTL